MNDETEVVPTEEAMQRIAAFIKAWCNNDTAMPGGEYRYGLFYTHEKWITRKETGVNVDSAEFHMINESTFASMVNNDDGTFGEKFSEFCSHLGYHVEQGHSWSWHFFRLDTLDFTEQRNGNVSVIQPTAKPDDRHTRN